MYHRDYKQLRISREGERQRQQSIEINLSFADTFARKNSHLTEKKKSGSEKIEV